MQIHLSPSASALAIHLNAELAAHQTALYQHLQDTLGYIPGHEAGTNVLTVSDSDLATILELAPDTVYRALAELRDKGALEFSSGPSERRLEANLTHWVWTAASQVSAPEDATL